MNKHTPGPWEWDGNVCQYDEDQEAPWLSQVPWRDLKSKTVLTGSIKCQCEADARLIAAAPDLLEALQNVLHHWNQGSFHPVVDQALEAIAKATGGAQ